ncbi:hypothetical protein JW962_04185 [Candidatus Dojkabacteria bacterium]|nr:hypothetical protein [Candidatus Dojkabacteria bacterium]
MKKTLEVSLECLGCQACLAVEGAEKYLKIGDDGLMKSTGAVATTEEEKTLLEKIAAACPASVIKIVDVT